MQKVHVRWMIRRDLAEAVAISQATDPFPWSDDDFIDKLGQRNCIGMVAEAGDRVLGYVVYTLHTSYLQIEAIATAPDMQRQGVGRQMMATVLAKIGEERRRQGIRIVVHETGLAAQLFFKACGFKATRIVRNSFFGPDATEDGYEMIYGTMPDPEEFSVAAGADEDCCGD